METHEILQNSASGRNRRWHEMLAEFRPEALSSWHESSERLAPVAELSEKVKDFIIIAIDAVDAWPGLEPYMHRAFDHGATVQELVDVCLVAGWLKGPHALNFGLSTLHDVVAERKASGRSAPPRAVTS